jgi:threonine synthase|tara:strand:- start:460 stop:714 length:255 start_codon:yes stop_codon:yes gene_type:complete
MAHFSPEDVNKLKQIITEGIHITEEVNVLKEGLKDTVTAIAEELDIKPAILNKAIRVAYKSEFQKASEDFSDLEDILEKVGRTL